MKNQLLYSVIAVLLLIALTIGGTYAFYAASAGDNNSLVTNGSKFEVIYTGGTNIAGKMNVVSSKEEGYNTTVNIKIAENSVAVKSNLYITIAEITPNLAIKGFIWEVYGYQNDKQVYYDKGNFEGHNSANNNIVDIVKDYKLSTENTSFTIYLWIDGNQTDNSVLNGSFKGYIGARSETFTGALE